MTKPGSTVRGAALLLLAAALAAPALAGPVTPVDESERPSKDVREADFQGFRVAVLPAGATKAQRAAARDADWSRLELLLTHHQFTENEKTRWTEDFVTAYQENPGLEPGMAYRLEWSLAPGPMRKSLEKIGRSPWVTSPPKTAARGPRPVAPKGEPGKAGIEWMLIPGGSYMMGSGREDADERPPHLVTVKSFEMAKTEVTNKQYRECVTDGACTPPKTGRCSEKFLGDDQPVVCVNLAQAEAFSKWAGGRVPTEAEWQYAARSLGKEQRYPWGNEDATCDRVVMEDGFGDLHTGCGRDATWPVCSKPLGNTDQGLCDMAGNAWEFVEDSYHDSYVGAPSDGSAWVDPKAPYVVLCGGSWRNDPVYLQAGTRGNWQPDRQDDYHGFRPMRPVP